MTTTCASQTKRIFVVDDHPMMRDGLSARISAEPDLEVIGEASGVREALDALAGRDVDLVVVDISLKDGHGFDLIKRLRKRDGHIKILVNSMYDESVYAERSLQVGAMGYVCKQTAPLTLITAIRTILSGKTYLSEEMTERILQSRVGSPVTLGQSPIETLSVRELEVLGLIGQGLPTGMVAKTLHLSVHTIDTYREKLKLKLGLENGAALNRYAAQWVLENG